MIWLQQPKNVPTAGQHTRPRAVNCAMPSGTSAADVQLMRFYVSKQERRCTEHLKIKRKASEVQEGLSTHRERNRCIANEHAIAEGHVNDGIGSLGRALQAAAKATHSLMCGVPDRESNERKCLTEATELVEAWQHHLQSGQPMSGPPSEHSEVILVDRQRQDTVRALVVSFVSLSCSY